MQIRPATIKDDIKIIDVLKAGLGESLIKKNKQTWQYKHQENPFGKSIVLVAEKDHRIAGVRAFMQWRWQINQKVWQAYRAVDTATHPDFQRQGIFKKLTLAALDQIAEKSECFVFNTPNENSRPGYLKMGWQVIGKIKTAVVPVFLQPEILFSQKTSIQNDFSKLDYLTRQHNETLQQTKKLFTPKSREYLQWRYQKNPMQSYNIVATPDFYIAYYVKKHRFFKELRVAELIHPAHNKLKKIKQILLSEAFKNRCTIITLADQNLFKLQLYGNFGPVLTFKDLTQNNHLWQIARQIDNWHYSLGDLELF